MKALTLRARVNIIYIFQLVNNKNLHTERPDN